MIIVSSRTKPFSYTDKGTPRRHAMVREYEQEIDDLYNGRALETLTLEVAPPTNWDESSSLDFVRAVVTAVLRRHVQDDADIFRFGCDRYDGCYLSLCGPAQMRLAVSKQRGYETRSCLPSGAQSAIAQSTCLKAVSTGRRLSHNLPRSHSQLQQRCAMTMDPVTYLTSSIFGTSSLDTRRLSHPGPPPCVHLKTV